MWKCYDNLFYYVSVSWSTQKSQKQDSDSRFFSSSGCCVVPDFLFSVSACFTRCLTASPWRWPTWVVSPCTFGNVIAMTSLHRRSNSIFLLLFIFILLVGGGNCCNYWTNGLTIRSILHAALACVVEPSYLLHFFPVAFPIRTSVSFVTFTIFSFVFFGFFVFFIVITNFRLGFCFLHFIMDDPNPFSCQRARARFQYIFLLSIICVCCCVTQCKRVSAVTRR